MSPRALLAATTAVLARPRLWLTAGRQARRLVVPAMLPTSRGSAARDYLRFRLTTQYGTTGDGSLQRGDVVNYLQWCHTMRATGARRRR